MSEKLANIVSLMILLAISIIFFVVSLNFRSASNTTTLGPGYFPMLLSIALFILCSISIVQSFLKENKRIELKRFGLIIYTILFTVIFFIAWTYIGFFYLFLFLYLAGLLFLYAPKPINIKTILINVVVSISLVIIIYYVFGQLMYIKF